MKVLAYEKRLKTLMGNTGEDKHPYTTRKKYKHKRELHISTMRCEFDMFIFVSFLGYKHFCISK